MEIIQTLDESAIKAIVTSPKIWPQVSDDYSNLETYKPPIDGVIWLDVVERESLGMYMVHRHNGILYEIHTCLLPTAWGAKALQAGRLVLDWVFSKTDCQKLITHVPETNVLALRYAKRCGMAVEGVNRQSFLKNGQFIDMTLLGITKKEHTCQQQQ
jgi:RimJ/RimL family protein N-acetyltransferase